MLHSRRIFSLPFNFGSQRSVTIRSTSGVACSLLFRYIRGNHRCPLNIWSISLVMPRWPKSKKKETEVKVKSVGVGEDNKDVDDPDELLHASNFDEIRAGEIVAGNFGSGSHATSYRKLDIRDALAYIDLLKVRRPDHFNDFLDVMKDFKNRILDTPGVIDRMTPLIGDDPDLVQGLNSFLPPEHRIGSDDSLDPIPINHSTTTTASRKSMTPRPAEPERPVDAISYVNRIKSRFSDEPDIYTRFLNALISYHREEKSIQEVYSQVCRLFVRAPDLLDGFKQFLPDNTETIKVIVTNQPKNRLSRFLQTECAELMQRSKIISNPEVVKVSHWTTGGSDIIACHGVLDTGAYADVFQVQNPFVLG